MVSALLLAALPLLACVPDLDHYTPTPVLGWERVAYCSRAPSDPQWSIDCDVGAYRIERKGLGDAAFTPVHDSPCYWYTPDETPLPACADTFATQRVVDDELVMATYCVKTVSKLGVESQGCTEVDVGMFCAPEFRDLNREPYP